MRYVAAVAVLAGLVSPWAWCQPPLQPSIVKLSPKIFAISIPPNRTYPESHCFLWVRLGGALYDSEVACYIAGVYTGRLDTAPAGEGFDGGFRAPGGGWIRWMVCNPIALACGKGGAPVPTSPGQSMYYELGVEIGDGSAPLQTTGYY